MSILLFRSFHNQLQLLTELTSSYLTAITFLKYFLTRAISYHEKKSL